MHRDGHPGRRPEAYWEFDVDRPDLLDLDPDDFETWQAYDAADEDLEARRLRYLAEHGLLRPEEVSLLLAWGTTSEYYRRRSVIVQQALSAAGNGHRNGAHEQGARIG